MAHSISAKKRIRQNARRRARNRANKRLIKAQVRAFDEAVTGQDTARAAETLKTAVKRIQQVAAKGTIHKSAASRKISRLQRRLNALGAKA